VEERTPVDVEVAWYSFHEVINMTSEELRAWLSDAPDDHALPGEPDLGLPELGERVVDLLRKRKVDLTPRDADVMERVVDFVLTKEAEGPEDMQNDQEWRRSLMTVGHDPTRP
jgi:hypothetical protein